MIHRSIETTSSPSSSWGHVPHISDRFGACLRTLRKERGYTQVSLAAHLGIDRSFISDVERGRKNLSLSYLETIALGFGLTLSELVAEL